MPPTDSRDARIAALKAELAEAKEAIRQAEKAMALCPALKEWGHSEPPKIEHHASRVNTLARQYADCVVSLTAIYDKEQTARVEIERLKGDGDRLDWLETHVKDSQTWSHVLVREYTVSACHGNYKPDGDEFKAETVRAAIDAARARK